ARLALHLPSPLSPPETTAQRSTAEDFSRRCRDGSVTVWSGGWSGARAHLLLSEELRWELAWSRTSDEGTGFLQLFGVVPECYFPHSPTRSQVERLAESSAVCAGYSLNSPAAVLTPGEILDLWFFRDRRWGRLRSLFVSDEAGEAALPVPADEFDVTHLVLPFGDDGTVHMPRASTVGLVKRLCAAAEDGPWIECLRTEDAPAPLLFGDGRPTPSRWTTPEEVARLISVRNDRTPHRDRTRRILSIAANPSASHGAEGDDATAGEIPREDRFQGRDVQGGITGKLSLDDRETTIHFAAGRFCGLSRKADRVVPFRRSQGFVQYRASRRGPVRYRTRYLETETAAWFTAQSTRGIRETAVLDGLFHLESTAFVVDDSPGIILNFAVTRLDSSPGGLHRLSLLEVPLVTMDEGCVVEASLLDPKGEATPFRLATGVGVTGRARGDAGPIEEAAVGSAVRLDIESGPLTVSAIDPRGEAVVPFCFAARRGDDGAFLVWYPFGLIRSSDDAIFRTSFWTATYRMTLGEDGPRDVTGSLRSEIDGFRTSPAPAAPSR
ncbi:MAG: hypothetical protein MI724_20190, partial [Spirochaetales bacterium]|nr:hypothetical protein [Spirochaetales bacterium]